MIDFLKLFSPIHDILIGMTAYNNGARQIYKPIEQGKQKDKRKEE